MRHQYQKSGPDVASVCIPGYLDAWRLLAFQHHNKHAGARCLSSYQKANILGMALTNEVSTDIPIRESERGIGVTLTRQHCWADWVSRQNFASWQSLTVRNFYLTRSRFESFWARKGIPGETCHAEQVILLLGTRPFSQESTEPGPWS